METLENTEETGTRSVPQGTNSRKERSSVPGHKPLKMPALRAFASEEALNELSRLAAQYSDVNCTPEDIHLYLDRIARGMPVASKAAAMSGDEITQYLQSMREKKQGTLPEQD